MVAHHIWQEQGRQSQRDQEYWLEAEQLLAIKQWSEALSSKTFAKRIVRPVGGKSYTSQPMATARFSAPKLMKNEGVLV